MTNIPQNGTKDQKAADEQRKRRELKTKQLAEKRHRKNKATAVFFAVVILLAGVISASILFDIFSSRSGGKNVQLSLYIGDEKYTLQKSDYITDGEKYINFSKIANALSLTLSGQGDTLRCICGDDYDDYAEFSKNDGAAVVNGSKIRLSKPVLCKNGEYYVPLAFIENYTKGISVEEDLENRKITVSFPDGKENVGFVLKKSESLDPVSEEGGIGTLDMGFAADLSAYEKYMNPENAGEYLILVNPSNPLGADYVPEDLSDVADTRKDGRNVQKMVTDAEKSLEAFLIEARAHGYGDITVTSAYRSYEYQASLFSSYIDGEMAENPALSKEEATKIVATYSAYPGTSEHQTGLCCDMHNMASAQTSFGNTDEAKWLAANAWKFGFILRFPEDKTDITGIIYEPWHFRFVGRYHAKRIYEGGLCLEEYIASAK